MRIHRLISLAWIFVATCTATAVAQGPDSSKTVAPLPEYVLEVTRPDGCVVSPISPKTKRGNVLYALPRSAKVPPDNSGRPITSKVYVLAFPEDEQWRVKVSIGTGEFYDAGDTQVGDFKLALNQRTSVSDAARFGVSPLRVGVVKIVREPLAKPKFKNLTQSVSLESIEAINLPDPFKLTLKNNSAQELIALQYNIFAGGRMLDIKWLSSGLLTSLIKVGESYKLEVRSEDKSCGNDEGYSPKQISKIDLVSAVFADGTYEGEPGLAALVKGTALGNRRNLERVAGFLGHVTDAAQLAQQLNYLAEEMNEEADLYLVETLCAMFPAIATESRDGFISFIRSGMHQVKISLKRDAQHLQALSEHDNPQLSKRRVEIIKAKYERWLSAAQKMTSR